MSFFIPCQTNRSVMSRCVACTPRCERECRAVKTMRLSGTGTNGRGDPVLMSQVIVDDEKWEGRQTEGC